MQIRRILESFGEVSKRFQIPRYIVRHCEKVISACFRKFMVLLHYVFLTHVFGIEDSILGTIFVAEKGRVVDNTHRTNLILFSIAATNCPDQSTQSILLCLDWTLSR